ncbi:DUF5691 domain-containing protein [Streptomyces sp. NPDC048518]|uniref:DUF5691 domain-containing protein n=1 Tax=Streptomyces sp. NPDC048518 TaxID=3155029 RepID=UPI0033ED5ADE
MSTKHSTQPTPAKHSTQPTSTTHSTQSAQSAQPTPPTEPTPPTPHPTWDDLVTAALLGTDRRPLPPGINPPDTHGTPPPPEPNAPGEHHTHGEPSTPHAPHALHPPHIPLKEPPATLLDAAAVQAVRRRAGLRPVPAATRPEPAAEDPRPPLPPEARRRLATLLTDQPGTPGGGRRGAAPDLVELLPQWLALANSRGYGAPPELLPALLNAARGRTDLRPQALTFAGPRALWLARLNPDWKFALRSAPGGGMALPSTDDPHQVDQLWEEGLFAERVALLTALRTHDTHAAGTARALLAATWSTERAEDRLMFLDSLRTGLSAEDEPFLEQALTDRSRNVRATAAELLSALPDSALAGRMSARAASCVALDHTSDTPTLTVEAPHECDAGMERDGVVPKPPNGRGERSWWLGQLVEAAPLTTWQSRLGNRTPAQIVALPVADDWRSELHAAWCRAAVRQRDALWSRALLGTPASPDAAGPGSVSLAERAKLLASLPAAERADWVAGFIAAHGLSEAFQLLGVCAVPWAEPLGRAVVDSLNIARDAGSYPWSFSGVMGLAERCLDPAEAIRLEALTAVPDEAEDASPGAGSYWSEAFQRLVTTLRLREAIRTELPPPAPAIGPPEALPATVHGELSANSPEIVRDL